MKTENKQSGYSRKQFMKNVGGAMLSGGFLAGTGFPFNRKAKELPSRVTEMSKMPAGMTADRVAADPANIPGPITRKTPKTHKIELAAKELISEVEAGMKGTLTVK